MRQPISAGIIGVGSCLPETEVTNSDLERFVETSDEWIVKHTGIRTRRVSTTDESLPILMSVAALRALDDAELTPGEIDYIFAATNCTDPILIPQVAARVQYLIGSHANFIPASDLVAACSGSTYVTEIGARFVRDIWVTEGRKVNILNLFGDTLWNTVESDDRTLCILSDAGGAMVLGPELDPELGIRYVINRADGSRGNLLHYKSGFNCQLVGTEPISLESRSGLPGHFAMDGSNIHTFVRETAPGLIKDTLKEAFPNSINPYEKLKDMKIFPHQTNLITINRMGRAIRREFGFSPAFIYTNGIVNYANNSTASPIIGIDEVWRDGGDYQLDFKDPLMGLAFGGGLTYGSFVALWTKYRKDSPGPYDLADQRKVVTKLNGKYDRWKEKLALPDREKRRGC